MANSNDANIVVNGQKVVATLAQSGTVVQDGGAIDATSVIQTDSGLQKVVKVMDMNGGGGGGGEQNIKAYHAPSATLDATLGVLIPNVDACTEQGLYNVDYSFESDGATITSNALLEVSETSMSGVSVIAQNLLINVGTELVYCTRNYMSNTFTSWSGQNIPVELAKCLQNKATGQDSVSLLDDTTTAISVLIGKKNANNTPSYGAVCIGHLVAGSAQNSIAIGRKAKVANTNGVAVGFGATAYGQYSLALGSCATSTQDPNYTPSSDAVPYANGAYSIQLGIGQNNYQKTLQVYEYQLLDGNTGKIPNERLRLTVADTSSTSATIANVEGGKDYTFSQALTALSITAITSSFVEANIYFTADTGITVTLPQGTNTIGDFTFTAGKSYVISIQNGIAVRGELN